MASRTDRVADTQVRDQSQSPPAINRLREYGRINLDSAVDGMKVDQSVVAIEHSREYQVTNLELRRST